MNNSVTKENLLYTLPSALANDDNLRALAEAVAAELEELFGKPVYATLYSRIDSLSEPILDALAADFGIDWWRPDASLGEKRAALKASWYVHRHLGTRSAVELAISDYLGDGVIEEWFEYGGQPHHFRIASRNNTNIVAQYQTFLAVLNAVKRCSSVLDHITALLAHRQEIHVGMAMKMMKSKSVACEAVDVSDVTLLTDENGNALLDEHGNMLTE